MTTNYHPGPSILSPLLAPNLESKQRQQEQGDETKGRLSQHPFTRTNPSQLRRNGENNTLPNESSPDSVDRRGKRHSPLRAFGDPVFSPSLPPRAESLSDFSSASTLSRRLTATAKRTMTVRALFDYDPSLDTGPPARGLAFNHGDILMVTNANDPVWWQARRVVRANQLSLQQRRQQFLDSGSTSTSSYCSTLGPGIPVSSLSVTQPGPIGLIPSRQRVERRHRSRLRHVNFFNKVTVINGQSITTTPTTSAADVPPTAADRPSRSGNPSAGRDSNGGGTGLGDNDSVGSATPSPLTDSSYNGHFQNTSASTLDRRHDNRLNDQVGVRSGSLPRNLLKRLSSWGRKKDDSLPRSRAVVGSNSVETVCSDEFNNDIRSYEVVVPITINLPRPLLVFGPLKDMIILALLRDPRFSPCVPHTSRPPRPDERDGFDYHFMPSREAMEAQVSSDEFIEVGQFQEHLYATSLQAVLEILKLGRVCLLDLTMAAVQRLEAAGLHPISVLVKPRSIASLRAIQRRLTEDQAKRALDYAGRLEADNWRTYSAIITYDTVEDAVKAIKEFTIVHGGPVIWVTSPTGAANSHLPGNGSQSCSLPRSPQKQNPSSPHRQRTG